MTYLQLSILAFRAITIQYPTKYVVSHYMYRYEKFKHLLHIGRFNFVIPEINNLTRLNWSIYEGPLIIVKTFLILRKKLNKLKNFK